MQAPDALAPSAIHSTKVRRSVFRIVVKQRMNVIMNNINAYHSSNDTNALHEPRTNPEDINPHLEKRVKKIGMEANYSFNETTSTQSVSSSNLGHRSG
jgi:hypothetical protein